MKSYSPLIKIAIFSFQENIRNRWLIVYGGAFLIFTSLILYFGEDKGSRVVASLLNLVNLLVPLFSLIFGSLSFHSSLPFLEVLLTRSISRKELFLGKWAGSALGLALAFAIGITVPYLIFGNYEKNSLYLFSVLLFFGVLLNFAFVSISFLISSFLSSRELVLALAFGIWFYVYLIYDLIIVWVGISFGDYPLEFPVLGLILFNPVDVVRMIILLQMDLASLLGFTAAFFQKYLGTRGGIFAGTISLLIWIIFPLYLGYRKFSMRDLG
jgi:Cu-processing system permease protein